MAISLTVGEYENILILNFGEDYYMNSAILTSTNYQFDNGMYVKSIEVVNSQSIKLWVEKFYGFETFTLTLSDQILKANQTPFNTTTEISPFKSSSTISNYNGLIKTWRSSKKILADSQRMYIGGEKGIDVLYRKTKTSNIRWGQIFDEYGISAMTVVNYPDDLIVEDTQEPYLTGQNPLPDSSQNSGVSVIEFTITDADTSIELTAITVYVNNTLAFRGGFGGWLNEYSGSIIVEYKEINFNIIPPNVLQSGEEVSVRVIATDLVGNSLDETYQFSITSGSIEEGWGGGEWGSSGWGGI